MTLLHWLSVASLRVAVVSVSLGAAATVLGLGGCSFIGRPSTNAMYPKMTDEAREVRVYFVGEQPECTEIISLGKVQARAGGFPDPLYPNQGKVNMDVALAWLRQESWKRGANGVRLLEHKSNSDSTIHMAIGEAFFCRTNN